MGSRGTDAATAAPSGQAGPSLARHPCCAPWLCCGFWEPGRSGGRCRKNIRPIQTCHRRFQQWVRGGKLEEALKLLARHLHERGQLNLDEAFVDATFASAKKGASPSALPVAARAPRSSLSPLITVFLSPYLSKALRLPSASLWKKFLPEAFSTNCPPGSSATRPTTRTRSTTKLAAGVRHRNDRAEPRSAEAKLRIGRQLRRYRRRWKVERLFAWMHNFRRLVTRWEYHIENFLGFVQLACLHILLRHL